MTREEAIEHLRNMAEHSYPNEEYLMAIKALEQEPNNDAISRQAVMDCYKKWQPYMATRIWDFEQELSKLPSVKPQEPKWIPVSERLPEDSYAVLVWCPERKNIYCAYREENQWWIFGAYFEKVRLDVKAWMPLPKPYEPQ